MVRGGVSSELFYEQRMPFGAPMDPLNRVGVGAVPQQSQLVGGLLLSEDRYLEDVDRRQPLYPVEPVHGPGGGSGVLSPICADHGDASAIRDRQQLLKQIQGG